MTPSGPHRRHHRSRASLWRHLRPGQRVLIGLAGMWLALGVGLAFASLVLIGDSIDRVELLLLSAPFALAVITTLVVVLTRWRDLRAMHVAGREVRQAYAPKPPDRTGR